MLNAKAHINVYIDGIAASMAGVIAMCGTRVYMNDFARIMVHNPTFAGQPKLNEKEQNALTHVGDMLNTLLSRRGFDPEKMRNLMAAETWFTADDALAAGLVDEVITTGQKSRYQNLTTAQLINSITKPNQRKMTPELINALGLAADASDSAVLDAVKGFTAKLTEANNSLTAHVQKITTLQTEVATIMVDAAINSGKVNQASREQLIQMGAENPETLKTFISSVPEPKLVAISQLINPAEQAPEAKDWIWYTKNDPAALAIMETSNPSEFARLYNQYQNL
jgi:hypothetical protein